jgi:hypothetical protein
MNSDEEEMRQLFGKALGHGLRASLDMLRYGNAYIGPEGRISPHRTVAPLKGEVRGGRWDGLDVEAS